MKMKRPSPYLSLPIRRGALRHLPSLLLMASIGVFATQGSDAMADDGDERVAVFGGAPADRWVYGAEVYLWGASVGGKTVTGDDIDLSFSDIAKNLDFGLMGTLVASKGKWTAFADLIYLDLSDDIKSTAKIIGQPVSLKVDVDLKGFVGTLGGAYSFFETQSTRLNVVLGTRYEQLDLKLDYDIGNVLRGKVSDSGSTWDAIVGLRGKTDLSDKWYLTYYADIGTGQSDLTWQALAAVNYRFQQVDAVLGYRYLKWDFDDRNLLDNLNLHGPFAGIKFLF